MTSRDPNLDLLCRAVDLLGPVSEKMVFLGGCATGLLLTDPAAPAIRATKDVDTIVEVAGYPAYQSLSKELRQRGFREDQSPGAPLCRWTHGDLLLDVMPTDSRVLGFANSWYVPAMEHAEVASLPEGRRLKLVTGPYFLATKVEAFDGRGAGDYLASHDLEDIVALLDGRPEIVGEITESEGDLTTFLAGRFLRWLEDPAFREALPGHLPPDPASQARLPILLGRIKQIAGVPTPRARGW